MSMTAKQERFVQEYLTDLNASAAATRAGYSPKRADAIGYDLLRKTEISEAIREAQQARAAKTEITAEYVLRRLKQEAELFGEGSSSSARVRAIELIGKHLGMFSDKLRVEHSGEVNIRAEIRAAALQAFANSGRQALTM